MKLCLLTKKGQKRLQNVYGLDFFQNGWIFNTHMLLHSPNSCIKNPSKAKRQYGIFHYIQHRCIKNKSKKIPSIIQTSLSNMQIGFLINGFKNTFTPRKVMFLFPIHTYFITLVQAFLWTIFRQM